MDLDGVVTALADGAHDALGADLLGLYLVGSHALGVADEHSDVDFVAVTATRVQLGQLAALEGLHARLAELPGRLGADVEGSYAPAADLRSPMTIGRAWPYVGNGRHVLATSDHDNTLHTRWVLRERSSAVVGPPARTYVAAVDAGALRAEMIGVARSRAEDLEEHPERLLDAVYQPSLVVTLCRALHTAHTAEVTGKVAAAEWALGVVGPEHHLVIRRAISDRPASWSGGGGRADPALAAPTRAFAWEVHRLVGAEALRLRRP